jgi:hypothetical protein
MISTQYLVDLVGGESRKPGMTFVPVSKSRGIGLAMLATGSALTAHKHAASAVLLNKTFESLELGVAVYPR